MTRRLGYLLAAGVAMIALVALPGCKKKGGGGGGTGTAAATGGGSAAGTGGGGSAAGTGGAASQPAGSGTGTAAAAGGGGDNSAVMDKAMALNEKIADAAEANKDDCKKMAAAISKLADDNADLLKQAAAMKAKMKPADMMAMAKKMGERARKYAPKMAHLGKCMMKSKELQAAMAKLAGKPAAAAAPK